VIDIEAVAIFPPPSTAWRLREKSFWFWSSKFRSTGPPREMKITGEFAFVDVEETKVVDKPNMSCPFPDIIE